MYLIKPTLSVLCITLIGTGCGRSDVLWYMEETDESTDTHTDSESDTETENNPGLSPYLVHVGTDALWHIDVETAESTWVCKLPFNEWPFPPEMHSSAFTRDGHLMVSSNTYATLYEILLPSCAVVAINPYHPVQTHLSGMCPNEENGLYGIDPNMGAFFVNPNDAAVSYIGGLQTLFHGTGATWVESEQSIYAITDISTWSPDSKDAFYRVDQSTGAAELVAELSEDLFTVGMEYHPKTKKFYACTEMGAGNGWESPPLFEVALDGTMTLIGLTGLPHPNCDNLSTPLE